jgi:hypothetical protein
MFSIGDKFGAGTSEINRVFIAARGWDYQEINVKRGPGA